MSYPCPLISVLMGLNIASARDKLQRLVILSQKHHPKRTGNPHIKDVLKKRQKLLVEIEQFRLQADIFMQEADVVDDEDNGFGPGKMNPVCDEDEAEWSTDEEENEEELTDDDDELWEVDVEKESNGDIKDKNSAEDATQPEHMILPLPSSKGKKWCVSNGLMALMEKEIQLRIGQANESLQDIRNELGYKTYLYMERRKQNRTQESNRRSGHVFRVSAMNLNKHVNKYKQAYDALEALGATDNFQPIQNSDLKINMDIAEEKRFGQSQDTLSWIWTSGQRAMEGGTSEKQKESKWYNICGSHLMSYDSLVIVERVTWLRAKARYDRSREAKTHICDQMGNTIRGFRYLENKWMMRAEIKNILSPGHQAYAYEQAATWKSLAERAQRTFGSDAN